MRDVARLLGEGPDHVTYLVHEEVVARFAKGAEAAARVEREARLLEAVAAISPGSYAEKSVAGLTRLFGGRTSGAGGP